MLSRLALRLAAVEALAPYAVHATGAFPTIAGARVFDSRQDPVDALDAIEGQPILIVYTEQGLGSPYPHGRQMAHSGEYTIDLTIEAMIAARAVVEVQNEDGSTSSYGTLEAPIMEREHEALLDLLEATVMRRLVHPTDAGDPAVALFRGVGWELRHAETVPLRDPSRTVRLAARTILLRFQIPADGWPEPALVYVPPAGLDRLPEPLRRVAKALDPASSGAQLCAKLAGLIADPAPLTALRDIRITAAADRDLSQPLPADFTADVPL
jgi:hypothetical protein